MTGLRRSLQTAIIHNVIANTVNVDQRGFLFSESDSQPKTKVQKRCCLSSLRAGTNCQGNYEATLQKYAFPKTRFQHLWLFLWFSFYRGQELVQKKKIKILQCLWYARYKAPMRRISVPLVNTAVCNLQEPITAPKGYKKWLDYLRTQI